MAYLASAQPRPGRPPGGPPAAEALPTRGRLPRVGSRVTLAFGAVVTLDVDGDPRARRTVGAAAEQLRLILVAHLQAAGEATGHAPPPQSLEGKA